MSLFEVLLQMESPFSGCTSSGVQVNMSVATALPAEAGADFVINKVQAIFANKFYKGISVENLRDVSAICFPLFRFADNNGSLLTVAFTQAHVPYSLLHRGRSPSN